MAVEAQDPKLWPLPEFYFKVSISDVGDMSFKEVSGLDIEYDVIEYRTGDDRAFTKVKMPGLVKTGEVTLKKGIFVSDKNFWNWIGEIKLNTIKRRTVTISLMDENNVPVRTCELANAWPKKISVEGFKAEGNRVAMETLVLVHEGIAIK